MMLRMILVGVAAAVALLLIVIARRPSAFRIERSIKVAAPPARAFVWVNDFHQWRTWSPYEKKDPQMQRTFGGTPSGTGATYGWSGNNDVGEGRMTIVKSEPPSLVSIKLEFMKPFAATNAATFTFIPVAGGTNVTWAMDGRSNFVVKAMSLFVDMDKMIGTDFEHGLAALKTVAESNPTASAAAASSAN